MSLKDIVKEMPGKVHERLIRDDLYALKDRDKINTSGHGRGAKWYLKK